MIPSRNVLIPILASLGIAGCTSTVNPPLVFVQAHTLGITASGGGPQATPELSLGYRDLDVAIVPVEGNGVPVRSVTPGRPGQYQDALSVLGQFNAGTTAGISPNV